MESRAGFFSWLHCEHFFAKFWKVIFFHLLDGKFLFSNKKNRNTSNSGGLGRFYSSSLRGGDPDLWSTWSFGTRNLRFFEKAEDTTKSHRDPWTWSFDLSFW